MANLSNGQADFDNTPTNLAKPSNAATLTVRIIKSFTFRTEKAIVLHDVNLLTTTCGELKDKVRSGRCLVLFVS